MPAMGNLLLGSTPPGARISVDGRELLTTEAGRFKIEKVVAGQHRVRATKEGYEPWEQVVEVTPNQEVKIVAELKSKAPIQPVVGAHLTLLGQDGAPMVLVPAGEFVMGSENGESYEKPVRRVILDAYYIDAYEVTNALYGKFLQVERHREPILWNDAKFNGPNQPVVGVSCDDAEAYCRWAGRRLPTEAEWEKAARGTDGRIYPWGNQWDRTRANTFIGGPGRPTPVGSYEADKSPYGAYDMAGNVQEWVADWYDDNYYRTSPSRNPQGPQTGRARVLRGGSWRDSIVEKFHSAYRGASSPSTSSTTSGLGVPGFLNPLLLYPYHPLFPTESRQFLSELLPYLMKITTDILESYLQSRYKSHLKLVGEQGTPSDYERFLHGRVHVRFMVTDKLLSQYGASEILRSLAVTPAVLKRVPGPSRLGDFHYIPVLFHYAELSSPVQRFLLELCGMIWGSGQNRPQAAEARVGRGG